MATPGCTCGHAYAEHRQADVCHVVGCPCFAYTAQAVRAEIELPGPGPRVSNSADHG